MRYIRGGFRNIQQYFFVVTWNTTYLQQNHSCLLYPVTATLQRRNEIANKRNNIHRNPKMLISPNLQVICPNHASLITNMHTDRKQWLATRLYHCCSVSVFQILQEWLRTYFKESLFTKPIQNVLKNDKKYSLERIYLYHWSHLFKPKAKIAVHLSEPS